MNESSNLVPALALGVVLLLVGLLPAVPRNRWIGVRTPWTARSDFAWKGANKLARPLFLVAGAITVVLAFAAPGVALGVGTGLALAAAVILTGYSWWLFSNDPDR